MYKHFIQVRKIKWYTDNFIPYCTIWPIGLISYNEGKEDTVEPELRTGSGRRGVSKIIYPIVPPKVEYYLTDFGKSLIPVILAIGQWGDANEKRLRVLIEAQHISTVTHIID